MLTGNLLLRLGRASRRPAALLILAWLSTTAAVAAEPQASIARATAAYVKKNTPIGDPVVVGQKVLGEFARVKVKSKSGASDPAFAFLKWDNGRWRVLTIGTAFEPTELRALGIPAALRP